MMRLLLAEDEPSLARALSKILEKNHYAVDTVHDGEEALQYLLSGNAGSIGQLVTVLMDNALKYTPEGGRVVLRLTHTGKTAVLTVENTTQTVFTPGDLEHLFDRFYRTDASRSSETGGHGIGLSVAQSIVAAHGGKLQATAPTGQFCIRATFPI